MNSHLVPANNSDPAASAFQRDVNTWRYHVHSYILSPNTRACANVISLVCVDKGMPIFIGAEIAHHEDMYMEPRAINIILNRLHKYGFLFKGGRSMKSTLYRLRLPKNRVMFGSYLLEDETETITQ